jgi:pimeloyl-ACP methyl ester carboxylesterase
LGELEILSYHCYNNGQDQEETFMKNALSGFIDVDGGKIYYEICGSGPALVLTHAGFVDHSMWDSQWEDFTRSYRAIRYDMIGYGKSSPAQGPRCRRDDLYHLLQQLGVERAMLLGCSMGGELTLDLALEHPQMAAGLVLVSSTPSGFQPQGAPPANLLEMIAATQQGDLKRASDLQIRIWVDGPFRQPEQVDAGVRQRAAEMNHISVVNETWARADLTPLRPLVPPAIEQLDQVHVPTLIIDGALDDPEILRAGEILHTQIPGAQKVILPESAHVPNMEKPVEFNQAVLRFLYQARLA